jgi:hypothetical protein
MTVPLIAAPMNWLEVKQVKYLPHGDFLPELGEVDPGHSLRDAFSSGPIRDADDRSVPLYI